MPNISGTQIFFITFAILLIPFLIILKKKFVCCDEESRPHSNNAINGIAAARCPPENRAGEVALDVCGGEIKNSDCSICIGEIKKGEIFVILHPCCHGFHVACVRPWFEENDTCPLCRATVDTGLSRVTRYRGNLAL